MRDQSRVEMIDRRMRGAWQAAGAASAYDRALEKARWILANHRPQPLPAAVLKRIKTIVEETEVEMRTENGEKP
jgi:trimethylamine--corrinoid protein Co-methyltransferase